MQDSLNVTESCNSNCYAVDAVMTLALALNKTLESPSLNLSLQSAIETVMFRRCFCELLTNIYKLEALYYTFWYCDKGEVKFDVYGNRVDPVGLLQQFRMDPNGNFKILTCE